MRKNFTRTMFLAAAVFGFTMSANAQESTASVTTNAQVIKPIKVEGVTPLQFGNIVGTAAGGTIKIDTLGVSTPSVNDLVTAQSGTISAAEFKVTGQPTYAYSLTLPDNTIGFTIANGTTVDAATMVVNGFTATANGTIPEGGAQTVKVGAVLNVGQNQPEGAYTSADGMAVTVQYN